MKRGRERETPPFSSSFAYSYLRKRRRSSPLSDALDRSGPALWPATAPSPAARPSYATPENTLLAAARASPTDKTGASMVAYTSCPRRLLPPPPLSPASRLPITHRFPFDMDFRMPISRAAGEAALVRVPPPSPLVKQAWISSSTDSSCSPPAPLVLIASTPRSALPCRPNASSRGATSPPALQSPPSPRPHRADSFRPPKSNNALLLPPLPPPLSSVARLPATGPSPDDLGTLRRLSASAPAESSPAPTGKPKPPSWAAGAAAGG
ncbi:unnamed protein product [Ectocarpus sp. 12 AP-2014]